MVDEEPRARRGEPEYPNKREEETMKRSTPFWPKAEGLTERALELEFHGVNYKSYIVAPEAELGPRPLVLVIHNYQGLNCLLYTSPSPRDATLSRMPSSA